MGRIADLEVRKDNSKGLWYVSVPPRMSQTGRRQRIYSKTRREAEMRSKSLRRVRKSCADMAQKASPGLIEDAVELDGLAKMMGFSGLREAFLSLSGEFDKKARSITFAELLEAYEKQYSPKWSEDYFQKRWKPFTKKLEGLEGEPIVLLDSKFWRNWLDDWLKNKKPAPISYNQFLRMLRSVFGIDVAEEAFPVNPLARLKSLPLEDKEVCVATPADVTKLLSWCWENDRDMVPYFALGFFSGMRPHSELEPFTFEQINFEDHLIDCVTTKTRKKPRRQIPISDNLRLWLEPFEGWKGLIQPDDFRTRYKRARLATDIPWGHDLMRHTYGSMFEAAHRSEPGCREDLSYNMGHSTFKMYEQHYRNGKITPKQAAEFWGITPPEN